MQVNNMKQPRGMAICFLTEVWERFGFYVIQALLILYMTHYFGFPDSEGYAILGTFGAFAYILPIAGGFFADRILGYQRSVVFGGLLFCVGYALLAVPEKIYFYHGLAFVALGNGFFKPNISTFLGTFYRERDPRRERGFSIFYVGINLGGALATMSSGYIARHLGWGASFLFASAGLLFGVIFFVLGMAYLQKKKILESYKKPHFIKKHTFYTKLIYVGTLFVAVFFAWLIKFSRLSDWILLLSGLTILFVLFLSAYYSRAHERSKVLACIAFIFISVLFWGLNFEIYYACNLFVDRLVDRQFWGHLLPTPLFITSGQVFILLLGGVLGWLWMFLEKKNHNPSAPVKFAWSLFLTGVGFFVFWLAIYFVGASGLVNKWAVVLAYFFISLGELLLSPIGLSVITELSPRRFMGMIMGAWFVSLGFGGKLAGWLATFAAIPKGMHDKMKMLNIYGHAFEVYILIALVAFVVVLLFVPIINRLMVSKQTSHNGEVSS